MNRKEICEHVGKIITGDRNQTHGDPFEQFECAQELKAVANNYIKGRYKTDCCTVNSTVCYV